MSRFASACLAASLGNARAWWDNGHMLTAQVARQVLGEDMAVHFDKLLGGWEQDFPGASDLVTAAVWPDLVKCLKVKGDCKKELPDALTAFSDWHYVDYPFNPDGLKLPDELKTPDKDPAVTWALQSAMVTFHESKTRFAFNLMLRFTIHFVGDLHQPMHAASGYFNDTRYGNHPNGDLGGNAFHIKGVPGLEVSNLHMFWDGAGGLYQNDWPYSKEQKDQLAANATELIKAFPAKDMLQYNSTEFQTCWDNLYCGNLFEKWANQTYGLAVHEAYGHNISEGQAPSAEYVANAQKVSMQQIALGGYRLADILKVILPYLPKQPAPGQDKTELVDDALGHPFVGSEKRMQLAGETMLGIAVALFAGTFVLVAVGFRVLRAQRAVLQEQQEMLTRAEALDAQGTIA